MESDCVIFIDGSLIEDGALQPSCLQPSQSLPPAPFAVDAGGSACRRFLPLKAKAQVLGLRLSLADSPNSETESSLTW